MTVTRVTALVFLGIWAVMQLFNGIAGRYDLMNTLMTLGLDKGWRKFTVQRAGIKEGGAGLDVPVAKPLHKRRLAQGRAQWHEFVQVIGGILGATA